MQKKNKIILIVVGFIIIIFISNLVGSMLSFFAAGDKTIKMTFINIMKHSFDKLSIIITLLGTAFMGGYLGWLAIKYNFFSSHKLVIKNERADTSLYGNARFLTDREMTQEFGQLKYKNEKNPSKSQYEDYKWSDLKNSDFEGYIVKSYKKNGQLYIQRVKQQHCLIIGTNGSGKSYYFLMPTIEANALSKNKASMIINDLKGELFGKTSKLLVDNGYNVVCINLRNPRKSTRFNPLDMIWNLYHEYMSEPEGSRNGDILDKVSQYIIEIGTTIVPPSEGQNKEFFEGANGILCGILWGMLEDSMIPAYEMTKDKFTFSQISNIVNKQRERFMDFLTHRPLTSKVWDYASMIIGNESERTVASYMSTLQTCLKPFLEEGISYLTATSDFELSDIIDKPTAIFLIIPDESASRYIIATTIIVQIYNYLTYRASMLEENDYKLHRTYYFLLDEYGNMPKIQNFAKYISTSRGRNIFFCPIVQATSQFKTMFSEAEATTIQDQCHLKIFMGSNEFATLEYFQKQLGTYSVYSRTATISDRTIDTLEYQGSTSITKKDLVTIDELQYKPKGLIYFTLNTKMPSKSNLVPFFDDELRRNGTFKEGSISNDIQEKPMELKLYNLTDREVRYSSGEALTMSNEEFKKFEAEKKFNEIEDVSDEYDEYDAREDDIPKTIDESVLITLGLIQENAEEAKKNNQLQSLREELEI